MTIKELINGILRTSTYELLIWSEWYFRPTRVTCKDCVEERALTGKIPDCVKCGLPQARLIKKYFGKKE